MNGDPLISVVMCTYNGLPFVRDAVEDIRRQTYRNWELVISDDGSTDGTRDWLGELKDDPRIRVHLQPRNLGYVRNKNFAIALARGEFVTQQDQDDRSDPERLERQLRALQRNGLMICGCGFRRLGVDGGVLFEVSVERESMITEKPDGDYPFWFPALMAHRSVHETVGEYPDYFAGAFGDDLYWTVRANERFPILCLPAILYDYRDAPRSITSLMNNQRKLVMSRILDHLLKQRRDTGHDDIESDRLQELARLEESFSRDRRRMAEQYRVYAARSIDQGRLDDAWQLLVRAGRTRPWHPPLLRTLSYYWKERRRLAASHRS